MTRDEIRYPEPEIFRPERFIDDDGNLTDDDFVATFGFGRRSVFSSSPALYNIERWFYDRICIGRYMASSTVNNLTG